MIREDPDFKDETRDPSAIDPPVAEREIALLQSLEQVDRQIQKSQEEKREAMKEFKLEIDGLEDSRDKILSSLENHRLGVQELPLSGVV
jgi:hypothetical protein